MSKAKKGDLVVITMQDSVFVDAGEIYEVVSYGEKTIVGKNSQGAKVIYHDEYEIYRKSGEEEDEEPATTKDAINPQHYKHGRVEVIDIIEDAVQGADPFEAVLQANIIKYTQRYRNKNGVEDLKKAQWYLNKLVSHLNDQK